MCEIKLQHLREVFHPLDDRAQRHRLDLGLCHLRLSRPAGSERLRDASSCIIITPVRPESISVGSFTAFAFAPFASRALGGGEGG